MHASPGASRAASQPDLTPSPPAVRIRLPVDAAPVAPPAPAAVSARPRRKRRRSWWGECWRWLMTALLFLMLAGTIVAAGLMIAIYRQARIDQARPAQAIVVLGTAQWNGYPGNVLRARLDQALRLYRQDLAPTIVVTGGKMPGDEFTEAEAAYAYLTEQGVPESAILMENAGRDSWESMQGVAAVLNGAGLHQVVLVSDGFHLLRVKLMARDLGLTAYGSPAPDSPIRQGGPTEFGYVVREAGGIVEQLLRRVF